MISRLLFLLSAAAAPAADFPQPYNSEKEAGAPMPAEEAAAKWTVPAGFQVSVFAAEPDVQNPIACAWDARGRLWVAENYTYAERPVKLDPRLRDRVIIFDGATEGRFTKRTVFTDEVQHLTSVEVGLGGVWLMAPPQLLFIPDKDGDDLPDGPAEVVLDGFHVPAENYHNFANGLRWGPDGWLYGRCGASCPGNIGAPGTPDAERVPLAGTIWRYHPERKIFEALASGCTNPWGHDWNENGDLFFINTVNGHLWHLIPGAHYMRPHTIDTNPHSYELIDMHADHWHFDTAKGWQASRDGKANDLGGGHAHCGVMIYLGDNWPDAYRGKLFTLNFHGRRMNIERLERSGSGYTGRHDGDAFFAADPWFRGMDLTYGPDGGVFVLDWSDTGECHDNTGVHRTSGRIYKITHGDPPKPATADLTKLSSEDLVRLHEHRNEWFARMARRVLLDRASSQPSADDHGKLRTLFSSSGDLPVKIRALTTLHGLGGTDAAFLQSLLTDREELVRAWAVKLLVDFLPLDNVDGRITAGRGAPGEEVLRSLSKLALNERSLPVRLALTSALLRLPETARASMAANLVASATKDDDHNLPLMTWYAISPLAKDPQKLTFLAASCQYPDVLRLIARRLAEMSNERPTVLDDLLRTRFALTRDAADHVLAGLTEGFTGWRKAPKPASWDAFVAGLPKGDETTQTRVRDLSALFGDGRALDEVKRIALDKNATIDARTSALRTLIDSRPDDLRAICEHLVGERWVNATAARGLALFDDPAIGKRLAQSYRAFHNSQRKPLIETLVSRPSFARALLDEIASGKIPREELSAFHARQIRSFNDEALTKRLGEVWGEMRESTGEKRELIAKLKARLTPEVLAGADKAAGRLVYQGICATCHTLYGEGGHVGPDLTGSGRANLDYLLENIVDPGAVVTADMRLNVVTLKDGRILNGMIAAKTDRTLTLKTATDTVTVERAEIVKQEELPMSLMPEGLLLAYTDDQVRDLIAYLMHPVQVPLPTAASK